ncbi:MAG: YbdK family carboxylate-amine ligase [Solirubrobacteraceae bacterium]|nr:YbdK family carboxylate-amine ligase [Solirubrobacteraceae bacterium]
MRRPDFPSATVSNAAAPAPDAAALRAAFAAPAPPTVGLEEELMLLDAATLDLAPRAPELLERLGGDPRFTLELPAAQVEIVLPPARTAGEAARALRAARADLAAAAAGLGLRPAGAGLHPFAAAEGPLNPGARYEATAREYGRVARRQLVFALQVHVAIRGADRALAVHNALRTHLPALAALAANAPFHDGRDTGMASMRPLVSQQLPRQGVPPALPSWEAYADALAFVAAGTGRWWWELRPHPEHGTLELRVADAQATVAEAAAVAAVAHALAVWLAERHDAGERLPVHDAWRIEENRWSACRWGVEGELRDLDAGGRPVRTRDALHALLDALEPVAVRLGCAGELAGARALVERNGALRVREAAGGDPLAAARSLAERYAT